MDQDIFFNTLRKKEYARLDQTGHIYLDYTGGNIYPQSLLDKHFHYLKSEVYGNPHSTSPVSKLSEKFIAEAREAVLHFFNAPDYYCVFTHNASGALHLVGECYPFSSESHFLLTADNHNSVNGIRQYCTDKQSAYSYVHMKFEDLSIDENDLKKQLRSYSNKRNKLFAYPAQSNASGVKHSLNWIKEAHENGWDVLLDAAAFVPTSKLDLAKASPEFVSLSFYKIFGYPTGIGCLLVKKSVFHKLEKRSFAGGTVTVAAINHAGYFLKQDHEKFENGTVNYLDIPAIKTGLDFIAHIQIENINLRVKELSRLILSELRKLIHYNGQSLVKIYGPGDMENRGGNFLINFSDPHGKLYPCHYIEQMAKDDMISLRTGCFCNPGIDELNNGISPTLLKSYFTSRNQGDYDDMINFMGISRGAVRLSIGFPTSYNDIARFLWFAQKLLNVNVTLVS